MITTEQKAIIKIADRMETIALGMLILAATQLAIVIYLLMRMN